MRVDEFRDSVLRRRKWKKNLGTVSAPVGREENGLGARVTNKQLHLYSWDVFNARSNYKERRRGQKRDRSMHLQKTLVGVLDAQRRKKTLIIKDILKRRSEIKKTEPKMRERKLQTVDLGLEKALTSIPLVGKRREVPLGNHRRIR